MIELQGVVKRYKHLILRFGDMCFAKGITVLQGHNGSGKSTLLHMMAGLTDYEGAIHIDGRVGLLSEVRALPGMVRVDDYLNTLAAIEAPPVSLDDLYETFDLVDQKHTLINHLSNGMQQKVHLISLFMLNCDVYLLDEPLNALDKDGVQRFKAYVERLDATLIITSHQPLKLGTMKRLVCT